MKNSVIILLVALAISIKGIAQSSKDSARVYKNEVGINLLPIVNSTYAVFNIFYKRQLKPNWYGRVGLILLNVEKENSIEKTMPISSSKIGIEFTISNPKQYVQLNLGVEKRYGKRKIKQFVGVDFGYGRYTYEEKLVFGLRDGIDRNNPYTNDYYALMQQQQTDSLVSKYKITSNSVVVNPFYGLRFDITKRFFFAAQVGISLMYNQVNKKYSVDNRLFQIGDPSLNNFDFRFSTVSNSFGICYRF